MKIWIVMTTDDLTEGRTALYALHFCKEEATARRLGKKQFVQGTDCPIQEQEIPDQVIRDLRLKIEYPSKDDIVAAEKITAFRTATSRAKELGLSDDEIQALRRGQ